MEINKDIGTDKNMENNVKTIKNQENIEKNSEKMVKNHEKTLNNENLDENVELSQNEKPLSQNKNSNEKQLPQSENLTVLYEDNHLIVVIKPQNVPSQSDITGDDDMLSKVKRYIKEKYNKVGEAFVGLVHRLDRSTGGIMVFAKNSKTASRLSQQIRDGEMKKTYYAVTTKIPQLRKGKLINYLKKDERNNIVKIVPQGEKFVKKAELSYEVLQTHDDLALVEVKLITGRSHQIRVQFAGINCALYGDNKYGKDKTKPTKNLGLWAGRLEFIHPTTKQKMTFACPPLESGKPWNYFYLDKYFLK